MREFEYTFDEGLVVGLRKHHRNPRNNQACVQAYNVRATPVGLEPYTAMTSVFDKIEEAMGADWTTAYVEDGYVDDGYVSP